MPDAGVRPDRPSGLQPALGLWAATAIGVGAIIGAGIFVVTGIAAGQAGSALVVSMLIAAVISLLTALSFAELAAWLPREGGVYELGRRLLSPLAGFLAGWMWMLNNAFAGAAVSLAFAYYLTPVLPGLPAPWLAVLVCLAFAALNYVGVRQSARLNNGLVIAKLVVLAFFCVFGALHSTAAHFTPFQPFRIGVLYGASYIFFAYGGFARVTVIAEEIRDPQRTVPRAILLALAVSTFAYIVVGVVAVGLVGAARLAGSNSPLVDAVAITGSRVAVYTVSAGGLLATASVLLTSILGVSRMAYAMARLDDLPPALGRLDPRHGTPGYAIWITGGSMAALVLFVDLARVVAVSTFALLFCYAIANLCALRLPGRERIYPRAIPACGVATCLALLLLILFTSPRAWMIGAIGLAAGAVYYVGKRACPPRHR